MFFHFKKCRNNNLKIGVYLFTTIYLLIILNLLEYLWVASQIISLSGDIGVLNVLNRCFSMSLEFKQHVSTHIYKKFIFYQHTFLSTNLILFAFPKLISIPKFHLMTKIWKYLDTVFSGKITHLTVNVEESVFTIKARSHLE